MLVFVNQINQTQLNMQMRLLRREKCHFHAKFHYQESKEEHMTSFLNKGEK